MTNTILLSLLFIKESLGQISVLFSQRSDLFYLFLNALWLKQMKLSKFFRSQKHYILNSCISFYCRSLFSHNIFFQFPWEERSSGFQLSLILAPWASEKLIEVKVKIQAVNARRDSAEYYKIHPAKRSCQTKKAGAVLVWLLSCRNKLGQQAGQRDLYPRDRVKGWSR